MNERKLKPGWKMVRFGGIAQNIVERIDPANARTDVYVGLEHLDPTTLHLRRWGHPRDVSGEKLFFQKGDIIFGKRRAYQRKLALAKFDGICSAHAMVLRPHPKLVLPEFFPFFLQSNAFMDRAVEISVGSLSPTINWGTLRDQEFALPPIEEQKRISEVLWAADEATEDSGEALSKMNNLLTIQADRLTRELTTRYDAALAEISRFGEIITGTTPSTSYPDYWGGTIPFVTPADISEFDVFVNTTERFVTELGSQVGRKVPGNSVAVTCIASIGKIGIIRQESITNQQINSIVCSGGNSPIYLYFALLSHMSLIRSFAGATAVPIINKKTFGSIRIPKPETGYQETVASKLMSVYDCIQQAKANEGNLRRLCEQLNEEYLRGESHV